MLKRFLMGAVATLAMANASGASAETAPLCATPDQAIEVQALYKVAASARLVPAMAARQLDMPEVLIASAMPAVDKAGTSAENFEEIWTSVTQWERAFTLIIKEGHVFEIDGAVPAGKRSERSNYFNLDIDAPFGGHIRSDQMSAIYALALPGRGGDVARSIHFFDQSGITAFSVVMGGEAGQPEEGDIARFDKTMALVKSMGAICPGE